jgi:hypothetical protein
MKLLQVKIRGGGGVPDSPWLPLSSGLNLFHFPDSTTDRNKFLNVLETINPPYSSKATKPFANHPKTIAQGNYRKKINPEKHTMAFSVFSSTPHLVKELATISPLLFEVDRIEVGRRLDYSRWVNFVELASSTRWSEISEDIKRLSNNSDIQVSKWPETLKRITDNLQPSDRITDDSMTQLANELQSLPSDVTESSKHLIYTTLETILRADYFKKARTLVKKRLPLFVTIDGFHSRATTLPLRDNAQPAPEKRTGPVYILLELVSEKLKSRQAASPVSADTLIKDINKELSNCSFSCVDLHLLQTAKNLILQSLPTPMPFLTYLQISACLAIAVSRTLYQTNPILLFDRAEHHVPQASHEELANFILSIASTCQCLYTFGKVDIFSKKTPAQRYSSKDLTSN